ncbi:nickel-dependent hydrogenase large subunit [Zavarzinia aquatilis]|uniref:nickel-dependent hydrogenase large subunit n=1 Tax=Zavarzinia aquatilis TaxID=2211142 RepID=UPI001FAED3CF|nr:nickel-dependent hydrogenase large subunit [Zavarzinia aquatilis]
MSDTEKPGRLIVGPFNRVEGDLEVQLDVEGGRVRSARVNSPLFRGFERILEGRAPLDALVIVPRICGICSVSQSHAAATALADLAGVTPPPNGTLAADLMLAAENAGDHLTHFHLFFMPDFARAAYAGRPWFGVVAERFKAAAGSAVREAVEARTGLFRLFGIMGGKWPHTLTLQPGGVARALDARDKVRLAAIIESFRRFLETKVYGAPLEAVAELSSLNALERWRDGGPAGHFRLFLEISADLGLDTLGRSWDRFLSYGNALQPRGIWQGAGIAPLDPGAIAEDHSFARMADRERRHHPFDGSTVPDGADEAGYTWCKAPRLGGLPFETGALARQLIGGHPLAAALVAAGGGTVFSRVVGRLLELARICIAMGQWVRALDVKGDWYVDAPLPDEGAAMGLTEAARGALGHWLRVEGGRIASYQIIAPTTWNFSPRDSDGVPGPLEKALEGTAVEPGERAPVAVQHVVRSFDPCMVCTVH